MFKLCILSLLLHFTYCQNANNMGKTYYFRMGKNNNEFKINNRISYLNHNISDYDFTHTPTDINVLKSNREQRINNKYNSSLFLDEEWNFNHKNIIKRELPLFIHKLYKKQIEDTSTTKTTTRILFNKNHNSTSSILNFSLHSLKPDETVLDAELYFFWPLGNSSKIYRESVVLRLYQIEKHLNITSNETNLIENPDIHKLFNVIYISKAQKGWQTFKIKKPIDNWLNGEDNLGLLLTISSYDDNKLISVFNDTNVGIYSTFAIVTLQSNESVYNDKSETKNYNIIQSDSSSCKRVEWNVSFKKLNWDEFIIAPDGFTAYDCIGKCEDYQNKFVNHIKLLRIFNKRTSYCVPTEYLQLPIMFYDKFGDIVIRNYQNMIITECGCR